MKKILWCLFFPIFIFSCHTGYEIADASYTDYRLESGSYDPNPDVENILKPYRDDMSAEMNAIAIISTAEMRMGRPESTLGNFAADATEIMAEYYTDKEVAFALHNYRGIRIGNIGKGPITVGRIYEAMPFDNYLVTVDLTGDEVQLMCDFMAGNGGWPSSASLTYEIYNGKAKNVKIDGKPIKKDAIYVMATNSYVVTGANYQEFLKEKEMTNTKVFVRDALVEYLKSLHEAGKKLNPGLDKRVVKK